MPRAPAFWERDGGLATILSPLEGLTRALTARRVARPGWRANVPVVCCGNVTVGGTGKTTLVLDLAARLTGMGVAVHVLLRGYGGAAKGVHRVGTGDTAAVVGDEALLLAEVAPTWTGADRAASARAAIAAGARALLMDDGLQNPTLEKDLSLLVIDGASGFGNGRLLPAGPLREPLAAAASRCQAAVLIGADATGALSRLPAGMAVWRADLVQDAAIASLRGRRVLAFAGIGRPAKFFDPLAAAGAVVVERLPFADHHPYSAAEQQGVLARAKELAALAVTTPKDAVRLAPEVRAQVTVIGVGLAWEDAGAVDDALRRVMGGN